MKENEHCEALLLGAEEMRIPLTTMRKKGREWLESQMEAAQGNGNRHSTEVIPWEAEGGKAWQLPSHKAAQPLWSCEEANSDFVFHRKMIFLYL